MVISASLTWCNDWYYYLKFLGVGCHTQWCSEATSQLQGWILAVLRGPYGARDGIWTSCKQSISLALRAISLAPGITESGISKPRKRNSTLIFLNQYQFYPKVLNILELQISYFWGWELGVLADSAQGLFLALYLGIKLGMF